MMTAPEHWEIPQENEQHKPAVIRRLGPKPKLPPIRIKDLEKPRRKPRTFKTFMEIHEARGTSLPANEHARWIPPLTERPNRNQKTGKGPVYMRWTPEREAELKAHVEQGLCLDEISKKCGISPEAISKKIRRMGLRRPTLHRTRSERRPWSDEETDLLLRLYSAGMRISKIAQILGRDDHCTRSKITYEMRRSGT